MHVCVCVCMYIVPIITTIIYVHVHVLGTAPPPSNMYMYLCIVNSSMVSSCSDQTRPDQYESMLATSILHTFHLTTYLRNLAASTHFKFHNQRKQSANSQSTILQMAHCSPPLPQQLPLYIMGLERRSPKTCSYMQVRCPPKTSIHVHVSRA